MYQQIGHVALSGSALLMQTLRVETEIELVLIAANHGEKPLARLSQLNPGFD